MITNVIVGAGELGSRHLQGMLKCTHPQEVYVVDPSLEALTLAQRRASEVEHSHSIHYLTSQNLVPDSVDVAIVATTSKVRFGATYDLLANRRVRYLILEKVLFPRLAEYTAMKRLIQDSGELKVWVNHPRRMLRHYQEVRRDLGSVSGNLVVHVVGANWGLGCNGLHFIDLVAFLTGSKLDYLDANQVDNKVEKSKRSGYYEFSGTLRGRMMDGTIFSITSFNAETYPISVSIEAPCCRWLVMEGGTPAAFRFAATNLFKAEPRIVDLQYQSNLTTSIVESLVEFGACDLPTYEGVWQTHQQFVALFLDKYNQITSDQREVCPIT